MSEEKRINFGTFETEVLPDQIIDRILELIKSKQLQPGDKLPPERELAEMMQVGRQTLRAALRALSAMDVIDIRRSSGAYITDLKPNTFIERLEFMFRMSPSSIIELFEARSALEVTIIRLAASRITPEEFEQLQAHTNRIDEQLDSATTFSKADLEFHAHVVSIFAELNFSSVCRGHPQTGSGNSSEKPPKPWKLASEPPAIIKPLSLPWRPETLI